jgi:WD40 repeat protein
LAFNQAGTLAATRGWEGKLRLWNPRTGERLLQIASSWTFRSRFSADDRLLLDRKEGVIRLWELAPQREFRTLATSSWTFFSPCNVCPSTPRLVAAGSTDRHGISLWDLGTGELVGSLTVRGAYPVLFDGGGAMVVGISGKGVHRFPVQLDPGAMPPSPSPLSPAPGGEGRVRGAATPRVRLGPPQSITPLGTWGGHLACSPDGRVMVSAISDGALVWHADDPEKVVRLTPQRDVRSVAVSADGRLVATGTHAGGMANVWDARSGELLKSFDSTGWVVEFSPDRKWLVTLGRTAQLWKVDSWAKGPAVRALWSVAFSPDSKYLALETGDGSVSLVEVSSGREFARLEDPRQQRAQWITFSPDGAKLLTTSREYNAVHVWDLRALRQELMTYGLDWDQPAFAPDGSSPAGSLHVTVDLGVLAPKANGRGK